MLLYGGNMWNRRQIKKQGRKVVKNNLCALIALGLLMTIVFGKNFINTDGFANLKIIYDYTIQKQEANTEVQDNDLVSEYVKRAISQMFTGNMTNLINDYNEKHNVTKGLVFSIFQIVTKGRTQLQNLGNSIANYKNNDMDTNIFLIISSIFAVLIEVFISYPIQIGESRIYLESRNYNKTKIKRITYAFKKDRYLISIKTFFLMEFYKFLWTFTIIGLVIKNYSYRMVKFIVAENPQISPKDAIKISREMMNGNKLNSFKLDISYIGWIILQYITFGLAGIYVTPYYSATYAEMYSLLRKDYIENKKYKYELLNDEKLFEENDLLQYPDEYEIKAKRTKIDYDKKYEITSIILFFFIFSFIGWLWEVGLFIFTEGKLINRGVLYGPWLPIYGTGCTFIVLLTRFKIFRKSLKNPILTFFIVVILCTIIEYFTSWYIEAETGVRYWDYTGIFLNINGRVCFEASTFFGLGGCICLYIVAPYLEKNLQKIPLYIKVVLCVVLVVIIGIDTIYSQIYPHIGEGITSEVAKVENK